MSFKAIALPQSEIIIRAATPDPVTKNNDYNAILAFLRDRYLNDRENYIHRFGNDVSPEKAFSSIASNLIHVAISQNPSSGQDEVKGFLDLALAGKIGIPAIFTGISRIATPLYKKTWETAHTQYGVEQFIAAIEKFNTRSRRYHQHLRATGTIPLEIENLE